MNTLKGHRRRRHPAFSGIGLSMFWALAALEMPTVASAQAIVYTARIVAQNSSSTSLGYLQPDPNYWTPMLTSNASSALIVGFTLPSGTTGTQINLTENDARGPLLGLVVGRDSTSSNIGTGNFNYLYLDPVSNPGTSPGAIPQSVPNYFATTSGLNKQAETAVWNIVITGVTGTLTPAWVNTDSSTPTTVVFIQSNHVYAGGDSNAFHGRFPAPVTDATLHLEIVSAVPLLSITSLTATPNVLWPPNQKMIPVTVNPTWSGGAGTVSCKIDSVSSSEPVDPNGDWVITGNLTLTLRAERTASLPSESSLDGRVYTITVKCTDGVNTASKTTTVLVPHDQGH